MLMGLIGWFGRLFKSPIFLLGILLIVSSSLFILKVASQPVGLSPAESTTIHQSQSFSGILHDPINAPHNLLIYLINRIGLSGGTWLRLPSVIFALIIIFSFYRIAKGLFGTSIGILGTLLFLSTPLFLVFARQASPEIMIFSIATILATYAWFVKPKGKTSIGLISLAAVSALFIYTPGIFIWLVGAAIAARNQILEEVRKVSPVVVIAAAFLFIILCLPLLFFVIDRPQDAKELLLVPASFPAVSDIFKNAGWMVSAVFIKTPSQHNLIVGEIPLLSIVQIACLVFGIFAMWRAARSKTIALSAAVVFAVVAAGINKDITLLALALPSIGIFTSAGLRYLYIEWRSVFPFNPVAKTMALTLMAVVVATNVLYGVRYSLVAWPNTETTKQAYVLK